MATPGTPQANEQQALQHLRNGQMRFQTGDLLGAVRELTAAVDLGTKEPAAYAMLGVCHLQVGRTAEALTQLERAGELAPNDPEIAFLLGSVLSEADQPGRAAEALRKCVQLDPNGPRGREAQALLRRVETSLEDAPQKPAVPEPAPLSAEEEQEQSLTFARVCLESGLERRARNELETVLKDDPENLEAWQMLAAAFEKLGEPDRAEECRQKIGELGG